jgi:hypothetical protein
VLAVVNHVFAVDNHVFAVVNHVFAVVIHAACFNEYVRVTVLRQLRTCFAERVRTCVFPATTITLMTLLNQNMCAYTTVQQSGSNTNSRENSDDDSCAASGDAAFEIGGGGMKNRISALQERKKAEMIAAVNSAVAAGNVAFLKQVMCNSQLPIMMLYATSCVSTTVRANMGTPCVGLAQRLRACMPRNHAERHGLIRHNARVCHVAGTG